MVPFITTDYAIIDCGAPRVCYVVCASTASTTVYQNNSVFYGYDYPTVTAAAAAEDSDPAASVRRATADWLLCSLLSTLAVAFKLLLLYTRRPLRLLHVCFGLSLTYQLYAPIRGPPAVPARPRPAS